MMGASPAVGRAQRSLRRACWRLASARRPRSALRGCHQAKRCGASRSLGVVSSAVGALLRWRASFLFPGFG